MRKNYFKAAMTAIAVFSLGLLGSCSKNEVIVTKYESTSIPDEISYNGGEFELTFTTKIETKSRVFEPWQYRVVVDGKAGEVVKISGETKSVKLKVEPNYSVGKKVYEFQTALVEGESVWESVKKAEQASALIEVSDAGKSSDPVYWTKANLSVKDGRYIIAESADDPGMFFFDGSLYAVPAEGESYAGKAYHPSEQAMELKDIPRGDLNTDPCAALSPDLRLPTYMEFYNLYRLENKENTYVTSGKWKAMNYNSANNFVLPLYGYADLNEKGAIGGRNTNVAYLGKGSDYTGDQLIYAISQTYSMLHFLKLHTTLCAVRCVRNVEEPVYVSHEARIPEDHREFTLEVKTSAKAFSLYPVSIASSDGDEAVEKCTDKETTAKISVPENPSRESRTWKIFVNGIFTGKTFVQPGRKNYFDIISVTPKKSDYNAFDIKIVVDTDLPDFTVSAKGSDNSKFSVKGTDKTKEVKISIPENKGGERTFEIYVNGAKSGVKLTQEASPASSAFSVIWSEGYITEKDGSFVFADPKTRGLYFKFKSREGARPNSSGKFSGTVYTPDPSTKYSKFSDVASADIDPCSLVEPGKGWRMPDFDEVKELIKADINSNENNCLNFTDGVQNLYFADGGQFKKDGSGMVMPTAYLFWTSDKDAAGKVIYFMCSASTKSFAKDNKKGFGTIAVSPGNCPAYQVRCVRSK